MSHKDLKKELELEFKKNPNIDPIIQKYMEKLIDKIIEKGNTKLINKCDAYVWGNSSTFEVLDQVGCNISIEVHLDGFHLWSHDQATDTTKEKKIKLTKHGVVSVYAWIRTFFSD